MHVDINLIKKKKKITWNLKIVSVEAKSQHYILNIYKKMGIIL